MIGNKKLPKDGRQISQGEILELLRKYDEEKELLIQQNKNLETRIFQEIDQNHQSRSVFEKRQLQYKQQIEQLQKDLARCRSKQQTNIDQTRQIKELEKEHHRILEAYAQSLKTIRDHEERYTNITQVMEKKDTEINRVHSINEDLETKLRQRYDEYETIRREVKLLEANKREISQERQRLVQDLAQQNEQLEIYQKSLNEVTTKYSSAKKRRKALESEMVQQNTKYNDMIQAKEQDMNVIQNNFAKIASDRDKLTQNNMTLLTKIEFLTLQLAQRDNLLHNMEEEHQKATEGRHKKEVELTLKYTNLRTENERYEKQLYDYHEQTTRNQDQYREAILAYQVTFKSMKDKILIDIIEQSHNPHQTDQIIRKLEICTEILKKNSEKESKIIKLKEKVQLLEDQIRSMKENKHKLTGSKSNKAIAPPTSNEPLSLEKVRLENQLNFFGVEMSLAKRQLEELKLENVMLLEKLSEAKDQLNLKSTQIATIQHDTSKLERFYVDEIKKCINELQMYKQKDIINAECKKEQKDYKQIFSLKMSSYEKKIKELIESIERKDGIIESFKIQKKQTEETVNQLQQRLSKMEEESESVKKARSDLARKDELMQQYRSKWEVKKCDYQQVAVERDKLRRENDRLQKSLERKGHYIQTVKAKHEKELNDIEKKLKSNSNHTKSISNVMEHKLIEIKKQCVHYEEAFQHLATYLLQLIRTEKEKRIASNVKGRKTKSKSKRKVNFNEENSPNQDSAGKSTKSWEAARILGLKESQIEEFLNPTPYPIQEREQELEQLWKRGKIMEFFQKAVDYLTTILHS